MSATITVTKKALEECISAVNQGVKVKISEVSLGTEMYTPSKTQTTLRNEMQREPISQCIDTGTTSVYFAAKFSGPQAYQVGEIAFWLDTGTLFGVVSAPNEILNYKAVDAHVIQPCTLDLSLLPADSVEVVVGVENLNLLIDTEMMKKAAAFVGGQAVMVKQAHWQMQLSERLQIMETKMSDILNALADVEKASQEQTASSQALAEEVAKIKPEVDKTVNDKIAEMDSKISQATDDVAAEVRKNVALILYVDTELGSPDNSGSHVSQPLDSVISAIKKALPGTFTAIYLKGAGQRHVLDEDIYLLDQVIEFKSYSAGGIPPVFTHKAYMAADAIRTRGVYLKNGSQVYFNGVDVETSRWSDYVSSGQTLEYEVPLFRGHGIESGNGRVSFRGKVTLNHSPLVHQHSSGAIGWIEKVTFHSATVSRRDLSTDLIKTGYQFLVEQYGTTPLIWDFDFNQSSVEGVTLPDVISPDIVTTNVRSTVPLTA